MSNFIRKKYKYMKSHIDLAYVSTKLVKPNQKSPNIHQSVNISVDFKMWLEFFLNFFIFKYFPFSFKIELKDKIRSVNLHTHNKMIILYIVFILRLFSFYLYQIWLVWISLNISFLNVYCVVMDYFVLIHVGPSKTR